MPEASQSQAFTFLVRDQRLGANVASAQGPTGFFGPRKVERLFLKLCLNGKFLTQSFSLKLENSIPNILMKKFFILLPLPFILGEKIE